MNHLIRSRMADLKKMTFSQLLQLPSYQGEKVKDGDKAVTLAVWKEARSEREVQIVVQVYRYWFLGIGRMEAQGFRIDEAGTVRDLAKDELYEFV